ncbi:MAG: DNA repair protein RecN [Vicingaceae bacterium]
MLNHLTINNYAIIDRLEIDLAKGFTAITGETGAGKSILLGALSLILGERADKTVLNDKDRKCIVEGEFTLSASQFDSFFYTNELDFENPTIIRREINSNGKSRAFINDTPVNLSILKELTSELIDIHSQHETLNIQNNKFQLSVVDAFVKNDLNKYTNIFKEYSNLKKQLISLKEKAAQSKLDVDYITFQAKEIEDLQLKPNEKEKIEEELELINNAEEIKFALENSEHALLLSDQNLIQELRKVANLFLKINNCSTTYQSIFERLNSLILELEDLANDVQHENSALNFDPENASYLNSRLSNIYSIEQKHNVSSSEEIFQLVEHLNAQLKEVNSYDDQIEKLTSELDKKEKTLFAEAKKLSNKRLDCFKDLSNKILQDLSLLGMNNSVFKVEHEKLEEPNDTGIDKINFIFSANKGIAPVDLKKAASGGELSRLMLVIKSILAKDKLSSIIFDEIDTGVSGDIADKMANIMKQMGDDMQVISITHLPQVAAKASNHYKIYKEDEGSKTKTNLTILKGEDRVEELAKMLSGEKMSVAAKENAKTLLNV